MPGSLNVQVVRDEATPLLRELERRGEDLRPVLSRWAVAARNRTQQLARAKGGRSFWGELARAVRVGRVTAHNAHLVVDHVAAAQKQYGGTIRPVTRKYLTIPVDERAKRRRAAEFGDRLFLFRSRRGNLLLGVDEGGDRPTPLFVLKKSVQQEPDPYLPAEHELAAMGEREVLLYLNRGAV